MKLWSYQAMKLWSHSSRLKQQTSNKHKNGPPKIACRKQQESHGALWSSPRVTVDSSTSAKFNTFFSKSILKYFLRKTTWQNSKQTTNMHLSWRAVVQRKNTGLENLRFLWNDYVIVCYTYFIFEWMCNTAREIKAATQPLCHSATLPEWLP